MEGGGRQHGRGRAPALRPTLHVLQVGLALGLLLVLLCSPGALYAQEPDSAWPFEIDPVVVTAERSTARLVTSTAAVSRVSADELRALPLRSVADALRAVPGITLVDTDGLGFDPQLMLRGFYGGGEAEYVPVLLDGRPLTGLQTGFYNWDLVPLPALESIEVVRGGASSLYGDAAVGGVINLVTRRGDRPGLRGSVSAGEQLGLLEGSLALEYGGGRPRRLAVRRLPSLAAGIRREENPRQAGHVARYVGRRAAWADWQTTSFGNRSSPEITLSSSKEREAPWSRASR